MTDIDVRMIVRAYDHVCPLFLGDAPTPGIRLSLDHRAPLTTEFPADVQVAEVSFNRYVFAYATGDDRLVGLPAFILRGFRHRNFFVRADSPLEALSDLRGRRLGTNSWPDTGTMWARAAMRDAGVEIADVDWVIGQLDEKTPSRPPSPHDARPPKGARLLGEGEMLLDLLRRGEIDAVTTAFAPDSVFEPNGEFRRLVRDYRAAEADYHRRTGVYPGFHIIAVTRDFAATHPDAVMTLYDALRTAWDVWWTKGKKFSEATPWAMQELETLARDFAGDTPPFGAESDAHRRMLAAICHEQHAQGLVPKPAKPEELFLGFDRVRAAASR